MLVIGKNDRGETVGVKNALRLLEEIPNKTQYLLGIVVDVSLKSEESGEWLEITVDPYPNPISHKGEYHYRSGSTRQVLRGAALNRFLLRRHGRNWDDALVPGVGLNELAGRTLADFRRRSVASSSLPAGALNESDGVLIEMLHLREGEYLRRAAVLLFHNDPARFGAFVKIGYFRKETDLAYQDVIEGNLFAQVDRTVDLPRTKYSKGEVSYDGIYRQESQPAPDEALREAVLNAVANRDYGDPAPIEIRVYDDRIALRNPGALPTDWTLDKLMGKQASAPHNPDIANVFFRAGMVEPWGRGIDSIVRVCKAAGTGQPRWEVEPGGLRLEFVFTRAAGGPRSRDPARVTARVTARVAARVVGGESASATGGRANVEGGPFRKPGAEADIQSTQQGDAAAHCRRMHRLHDPRKALQPVAAVSPDGQWPGCRRRVVGREYQPKSVGRAERRETSLRT